MRFVFIMFYIGLIIQLNAVELRYNYQKDTVLYIETKTQSTVYVDGELVSRDGTKESSFIITEAVIGNKARLTANIYTMEERSFFDQKINKITQNLKYNYTRDIFGKTTGLSAQLGFHDFPFFPDKNLNPGDSWVLPAEYLIAFYNKAIPAARLELDITYRYAGTEIVENNKIALITANAVVAQIRSRELLQSAKLFKIAGFHNFFIKFDLDNGRIYSIDEVFDYFYVLHDYTVVEFAGNSFSSFKMPPPPEIVDVERMIDKRNEKVKIKVQKDRSISITLEDIRFMPDSAHLLPEEKARLDRIAKLLRNYSGNQILIIGHTAEIGSPKNQQSLSEERARVVLEYLVRVHKFKPGFMSYQGKGSTEPLESNTSEAGRAKNRRVEIVILPKI